MALQVSRIQVWIAPVEDRPGAAAEKLAALAAAGANLECVIGARDAAVPTGALLSVYPIKGAAQIKAAKAAGFRQLEAPHVVRVAGSDKQGLGAKITQALADAGLNLHILDAFVVGKSFACLIALDAKEDAAKAVRALKGI